VTTPRYAAHTDVPAHQSRSALDQLLAKHGAKNRGIMSDDSSGTAVAAFFLEGRAIRLSVSFRRPAEVLRDAEREPPRGWRQRTALQRQKWAETESAQEERQRWRALLLITRAKLEMIADGMSTVDREFLASIMLSDGRTVEERLVPDLPKLPPSAPLLTIGAPR
jgi:hypothetical protein